MREEEIDAMTDSDWQDWQANQEQEDRFTEPWWSEQDEEGDE